MTSPTSRIARAKQYHAQAVKRTMEAAEARQKRDQIIRELHSTGSWSYSKLSAAIGLTEARIAAIVVRRKERARDG